MPIRLRRWNRQSVPKRRHIKFRRWGITQKKAYNIRNKAKVWNKEKHILTLQEGVDSYFSLLSYKTMQSWTKLPVFWRNIQPRSSGYPADIDSMFSTRHSACISCFVHVSTLFILILQNTVVCIPHAVAYKIKVDGKFAVSFEWVRNWKHVFVVYDVLLVIRNYSEAPLLLQSVIQSGRGYQPITVPCSAGRIMLHDP
jgi:hypothetical protein